MKKTYKTLTGAYTAAQNAGAKVFGSDYYAYANRVDEILARVYKHKNAILLAKCNLFKFEKTLCALEFVKDKGYKWTAVGHFDNEGLLYPMSQTEVEANPKQTVEEHDKVIEDKPQSKSKPRKAKGNGIDFSKVEGKTKSARNKSAHKLILATGVKVGTDEYKSLWEQWTEVR